MPAPRLIALFILCTVPALAWPAQVLRATKDGKRVLVTQLDDAPWGVNDKACIFRNNKRLACGQVSQISNDRAIIVLYDRNPDVKRGDSVTRLYTVNDPASPSELAMTETRPEKERFYLISLGADVSAHYFFPYLAFDALSFERLALGARIEYLSRSSPDVRGFSTMVTISYYARPEYQGLWLEAGAGMYLFSSSATTGSQTSLSPAFAATAGWRYRLKNLLDLGAALGLQYITPPDLNVLSVSFSSLQPIVLLSAGYNF